MVSAVVKFEFGLCFDRFSLRTRFPRLFYYTAVGHGCQIFGSLCLAAEHGDFFGVKAPDGEIRLVFQFNTDSAAEEVYIRYHALSVGSVNECIHLRRFFYQVFIGVLLVLQTAHKPAAGAGNFCRIQ